MTLNASKPIRDDGTVYVSGDPLHMVVLASTLGSTIPVDIRLQIEGVTGDILPTTYTDAQADWVFPAATTTAWTGRKGIRVISGAGTAIVSHVAGAMHEVSQWAGMCGTQTLTTVTFHPPTGPAIYDGGAPGDAYQIFEIDGGRPGSVYLPTQLIDGGI